MISEADITDAVRSLAPQAVPVQLPFVPWLDDAVAHGAATTGLPPKMVHKIIWDEGLRLDQVVEAIRQVQAERQQGQS